MEFGVEELGFRIRVQGLGLGGGGVSYRTCACLVTHGGDAPQKIPGLGLGVWVLRRVLCFVFYVFWFGVEGFGMVFGFCGFVVLWFVVWVSGSGFCVEFSGLGFGV